MNKLLVAVLFMLLPVTACSAPAREHRAEHLFLSGPDENACTAYAVGPHAVETAEHCLVDGAPYVVDGTPVEAKEIILDHKDHVILVLGGIQFKDFVVLKFKEPKVGDKVHSYINPLAYHISDQYIEGYRSGSDEGSMAFFLPIVPGASGSIIFNSDGSVAGIVSQGIGPYAFSNRLGFTASDLAKAAAK